MKDGLVHLLRSAAGSFPVSENCALDLKLVNARRITVNILIPVLAIRSYSKVICEYSDFLTRLLSQGKFFLLLFLDFLLLLKCQRCISSSFMRF